MCRWRLTLRLFVHAQHQRTLGRIEIEPDDVAQLRVELRVAAELESLHPVRLQAILLPDAMHGGGRETHFSGQAPRAPMGCGFRLAQRRANHRLLLCRRDSPRSARSRQSPQPGQSRLAVTPPPQTDRGLGYPTSPRQCAHAFARRAPPLPYALASPAHAEYSAHATTAPTRPDLLRLLPPRRPLRPCWIDEQSSIYFRD
jgi:hypothetical protein